MQVDEFGGKQKKPKNATADEKTQGWETTPKNEIPKALKEEVEIEEGKFKKGDIVIPNMGPHKGDKHKIIHDFKDGSYNIAPIAKRNIKYDQGAAKAKENQLKLVKEEVELGPLQLATLAELEEKHGKPHRKTKMKFKLKQFKDMKPKKASSKKK